jgi:hypothetical protein
MIVSSLGLNAVDNAIRATPLNRVIGACAASHSSLPAEGCHTARLGWGVRDVIRPLTPGLSSTTTQGHLRKTFNRQGNDRAIS